MARVNQDPFRILADDEYAGLWRPDVTYNYKPRKINNDPWKDDFLGVSRPEPTDVFNRLTDAYAGLHPYISK